MPVAAKEQRPYGVLAVEGVFLFLGLLIVMALVIWPTINWYRTAPRERLRKYPVEPSRN